MEMEYFASQLHVTRDCAIHNQKKNVGQNFPNNSECSEQSNLSFKVNSGPKTNFRVEGIDEESVGKGGHQNPGQLVSIGFRDWKKAKESFKKHMEKEYHKECVLQATSFLKISARKQLDIASQLDSQRTKEIAENRTAIKPIIRTILFCAEQELPLRSDHDSGALSLTQPEKKDGKFRALLRFRIESGDKNLEKHVLNSSKNATYMSPIIQNEVIQTCSDIVTEKVIDRISNAECFSLLGDETMDVSGTEQLSLCIRYVDIPDLQAPVLREDFVGFIPINDQSS
ncbi:zinc finger MYM-type protein 1 [Trichonephila clavata]|uniref:Zinc finger MYM-type protein 1 n=1 Tax=Trichonephila clavata TaxID=2740835 RepID=A0A8X6HN62_TRICU|nr:zinc finger MYM-type protein 1 [Trichonephila clavata]